VDRQLLFIARGGAVIERGFVFPGSEGGTDAGYGLRQASHQWQSEKSIRNEIAVVKAFKKAGFGDVKPHVDVKTFNKRMLDDGLRPAEGSMSIRVAHLRLFHRSQCRPVTAEEKAARQQQSDAAVARHMGKVIPINAEANPQ